MRKGLALILVVGVLAVLAVLGSAFAVLSRLERRAALQRVWGTQALLLARSGLEDAQARLAQEQDPDLSAHRYGGEDWDLSGGPLSAFESPNEVYRPGNPDREACPVRQAMRPSFFARLSSGNPITLDLDGRKRGYSGLLSGHPYGLKVIPQAGFFVNGGDPSLPAATSDYNTNLRRMLGILAKAVDEESAPIDGNPVSESDGFNLIDARPRTARGWDSWEQVRDLALGGSQARLDALRPYLSLRSWVDRKVIQPNAYAPTMDSALFTSMADMRMAHRSLTTGTALPDFERIPLTPTGRIVGRAPVHLGWARKRRPVLLALLGDLVAYTKSGLGAAVGTSFNPPRIGSYQRYSMPLTWAAGDAPHVTAGALAAYTTDIRTWDQWNAFCTTRPIPERDLLKAWFNPNSDLKMSYSAALKKTIDKSDVLVGSTELCLEPVHDHELECIGRVLGADGRTLASRVLKAVLPGPSVFRLDTQRELVCEDLGRLDVAGDETDVRLPGRVPFLTLSAGLSPTWGHTLPGLGGTGLALQSYPEPVVDPGGGLEMRPASYDGHLELATVETRADDFYGLAAGTMDMKMLARFDQGLDLDLHDDPAFQNLTDTSQVTTAQLGNGFFHPTRPVSMLPDGVYSEQGHVPAFPDAGNANGLHGILSFWLRHNGISSNCRWIHWTRYGDLVSQSEHESQCFYFGPGMYYFGMFGMGIRLFVENTCSDAAGDNSHEWVIGDGLSIPSSLWTLYTVYYDFEADDKETGYAIVLNDGSRPQWYSKLDLYMTGTTFQGGADASDITQPDALGTHRISLGGRPEYPTEGEMFDDIANNFGGFEFRKYDNGADATIDEFAIYDFGRDFSVHLPFAAARYKEGRYAKGSDHAGLGAPLPLDPAGAWFSGPVALPAGTRIRKAAWSFVKPRLPNDYAEIALADVPGTGYLFPGARSTLAPGWTKDRNNWTVGHKVEAPFRLHAVFRRTVPTPADVPLTDSPVLDDISLHYDPPCLHRLLGFRAGE